MKTAIQLAYFALIFAMGDCFFCNQTLGESFGPPPPKDCMSIFSSGDVTYAVRRDTKFAVALNIQVRTGVEEWSSIKTEFQGLTGNGVVSSIVKTKNATLFGIQCVSAEKTKSICVCRIEDDGTFGLLPIIKLKHWNNYLVRLISGNGCVTVVLRQMYTGDDIQSAARWQGHADAFTWTEGQKHWEKRASDFKDVVKGPNESPMYLTWNKSSFRASKSHSSDSLGATYEIEIPGKTAILAVRECFSPMMLIECQRESRIRFYVADFSKNRLREIIYPRSRGHLYDPHLLPSHAIAAAFSKSLNPGYVVERAEIAQNKNGDYGAIGVKESFSKESGEANNIRVIPTNSGSFVYWDNVGTGF